MDGTLVPFEQDDFIKLYFQKLCEKLVPLGYAPEAVVKGVWGGTKAMLGNDGAATNRDRFWDGFAALLGEEIRQSETMLDSFYTGDFHKVKAVMKGESCARAVVDTLKAKGYTLVLATNPLFPDVAQHARLSWVGLTPDDFVHVTHYQNSHFCKPDLRYYEEILSLIGKTPEECLMVGNSVSEDMAARRLGMAVYLVNEFVENPENEDFSAFEQGTLADFLKRAEMMPSL